MVAFKVVRETLGQSSLCQCPSGQTQQRHPIPIPRGQQHLAQSIFFVNEHVCGLSLESTCSAQELR
uniref:Uncharacterized protein n=1 Tax=Suricata suricatta TaxID=37032 RepID=A0A673V3S8_SURSU